jgi:hypothetical protein
MVRRVWGLILEGYRGWRSTVRILCARDQGWITDEESREMLDEIYRG